MIMRVMVDTSAILAYTDPNQPRHGQATEVVTRLAAAETELVVTNYILVETISLMQRRQGMDLVRSMVSKQLPWFTVEWVDPDTHSAALFEFLLADRRQLSLVDCATFEVMRRQGIRYAVAFDPHFAQAGFPLPPLD
jgi:predicted nucleic acid-binding protein